VKLPERIPKRLRASALFLPEFGDGEGAWPRADAIAVIKSLKGSTVAVSEVVLFERVPWGYAASESAVAIDRLPNEADPDYAQRSRSRAGEFIRDCATAGDDALFGLTFPMWKDAA
jgi:hypothetical protein